ncbi:hypothetical protein ABIB37_001340 [Agrococcus sp. UYP10]|uniref:DUF2510 domain-containing protein n=1 Tax=Agrococcus sp. UYP10 TaxID=1756355 RepID=UPI003395AAA7
MPSFLIVHCASQDGRIDAYRQPPTLDIGGLRVPLDWGDTTLHVPAGDLPVTVFVTRTSGQVEGAKITVRAPAGTGTRLTFVPPMQPGGASHLRIDGQWPADSSMHYYAARDARTLAPPAASSVPTPHIGGGRQVAQAGLRMAGTMPPPQPAAPVVRSAPMQSAPVQPAATQQPAPLPPVGPTPGSTASVPPRASSFGQQQGALVDPVVPASQPSPSQPTSRPAPQQPAPQQPAPQQPAPQQPAPQQAVPPRSAPPSQQAAPPQQRPQAQPPSFGQRKQPPPILTPAEFDRLEREAQEQQTRAYEAWVAQQHARAAQQAAPGTHGPAHTQHDGAPRPVGLPTASTGQAQPAWYPDPYRRADARWFDGRQWTSSVMRAGVRVQDLPG